MAELLTDDEYNQNTFSTPEDRSSQAPEGWGKYELPTDFQQPQNSLSNSNNSIPEGTMDWQFGGGNQQDTYNPMAGFQNNNLFGSTGNNFYEPQQSNFDLMGMFDKGLGVLNRGLNLSNSVQGAQGGNQNTNTMLKSLAGLWAAQQEKKAQSQYGQQTQQAAQQMQQNTNPFSAERARYQQELAAVQDRLNQFRQNPNANQQYKTLQDQLIMQANRGSRQRGTSDVQMASALASELTKAQMSIENQMLGDRKDLYTPAGANLNGSAGILEAMLAGNKASTTANSNASYASVIGKLLQGDSNQTAQNLSSAEVEKLRAILGQR